MGRLYLINLEGRIYSCKHCQTHLALYDDIVSKSFHCRHGKAYLFNKVIWRGELVHYAYNPHFMTLRSKLNTSHGCYHLFSSVNVSDGEKEERIMTTGMHTVADIFCVGCGSIVGWKYEAAYEKSQKYKEGKFILERFKVSGPDGNNYWISHETQVGGSDADDA